VNPKKKSPLKKEKTDPQNLLIEQFEQHLVALKDDPGHLLLTLLYRDKINAELKNFPVSKPIHLTQLLKLDKQFQLLLGEHPLDEMGEWRKSIDPETATWWWNYDKEPDFGKGKNLLWLLLASVLFIVTTALAYEIIKRFWEGAPDSISVVVSLITVFITSSPLLKQGRALARLIFKRIKVIKSQYQAQAMAIMALISFALILLVRVWGVPNLSLYYNNKGFVDLHNGNVTNAQQAFVNSLALNPNQVVPYQNLASVFQQIGFLENSISLYQKAIMQDINFTPAYSGLGHLYNLQGDYNNAESVILAGLNINSNLENQTLKTVAQYNLLSNLGWAYYSQNKYDFAISTLEEAISLEAGLKELGESKGVEYRSAIPHFFLAQAYDLLGQTADAHAQWEEGLRYLDSNNWNDKEWIEITLSHLK